MPAPMTTIRLSATCSITGIVDLMRQTVQYDLHQYVTTE
jgi:hypothetical protein